MGRQARECFLDFEAGQRSPLEDAEASKDARAATVRKQPRSARRLWQCQAPDIVHVSVREAVRVKRLQQVLGPYLNSFIYFIYYLWLIRFLSIFRQLNK